MKKRILSVLLSLVLCLAFLPAAAYAADEDALTYLALGDSITAGYGLNDVSSDGFAAKLGASLGAAVVVNQGVNGQTAAQLLSELNSGAYDDELKKADVISITIGGNDLLAAFYVLVADAYNAAYGSSGTTITAEEVQTILADPSGNRTVAFALVSMLNSGKLSASLSDSVSFQTAVAACLSNISSIVLSIRSVNEDAVILVANQYNPYQWLGYAAVSSLFSTGVGSFNAALSASAGSACAVVDVAAAFARSTAPLTNAAVDLTTGTYSFDFHPNTAGHAVIADAMLAAYEAAAGTQAPDSAGEEPDASLWYQEYIDFIVENGLMDRDAFEPDRAAARGMIATMLYRLEGEPAVSGGSSFEDVASAQYYADAVVWAAQSGIMGGYGNGRFGPEDTITREQLATVLYRYAQYKGYDVSVGEDTNILSFDDAFEISAWAFPAMQWACGAGILQGDGTSLIPAECATMAQAAALLMRFVENVAA